LNQIIKIVSETLEIPIEVMLSKSRHIENVEARAVCAHLMREQGMILAEVGRTMKSDDYPKGRTHDTILYYLNMVAGDNARDILKYKRRQCEEAANLRFCI